MSLEISLQNNVTNALITMNMISTQDYILETVDWGVVESNHHSYKYVNQIGEYVTGTTLETRNVSIVGWVVANTEDQMSQRKSILNKFVNPQQLMTLFYDEYELKFLPDTSVKYSVTVEENNEIICKFKIAGFCANPLFTEKDERKVVAANTVGKFHFPLVLSATPAIPGGVVFGCRQPSLIVGIENKGSVDVGMMLVFKAKGTVVNPSIINVNTQEFFKLNKTLQAGEQVKINTITGEKKIRGYLNGVEGNYFKYRDLDSDWLQLTVGDNLFRYDADSNLENLEVYIYYKNNFLEVQKCF